MRADDVRKAREQIPFKPFTIFVSDQRQFEVSHPDFLWIIPGGRAIGISDQNGLVDIIDLMHVTGVKREAPSEG